MLEGRLAAAGRPMTAAACSCSETLATCRLNRYEPNELLDCDLTRVAEILQRRHAERAPALEKKLAQLAAEQQRCRQEGKRVLQAIGGNEARSDMTTKRLTELDARDLQLEQRMAELRDELSAIQRESVSTAQIQRAVALFDPVWDLLLVPERFHILHLLLELRGL